MAHFLCVFYYTRNICPLGDYLWISMCAKRCANCGGKVCLTLTWSPPPTPPHNSFLILVITFNFIPSPDGPPQAPPSHPDIPRPQIPLYVKSEMQRMKANPWLLHLENQGPPALYNRCPRIWMWCKLSEDNFLVAGRGREMKTRSSTALSSAPSTTPKGSLGGGEGDRTSPLQTLES